MCKRIELWTSIFPIRWYKDYESFGSGPGNLKHYRAQAAKLGPVKVPFAQFLSCSLPRSATVLFVLLVIIGCQGCVLGAIPLAVDAVEGVGSAVVNGAIGSAVEAHQNSVAAADKDHPGEDPLAREDRCADLEMNAPNVIEVRLGAGGAPEYRELQVSGSLGKPQWEAIVGQGTNAAGWRPALHLLQMNFTPPLGPLPKTGSEYIAYRPLQSDSGPVIELVPLTVNFGKGEGTFVWKGATYRYALGEALPCFPPPPQP